MPQLSMIELLLGCSAFRISISLLPYYQAEERFEEKRSFMKLIETNLSNWAELWKLIIKKFPEVSLKKIPELLNLVDKIIFEQVKDKLSSVGKVNSVWRNNSETMLNWSAMLRNLVIAVVISALWMLRSYKRRLIKQNVPASMCKSERDANKCPLLKQIKCG